MIPFFNDLVLNRVNHYLDRFDATIEANPGGDKPRYYSLFNTSGLKLRKDPRLPGHVALAFHAHEMYRMLNKHRSVPEIADLLASVERTYEGMKK